MRLFLALCTICLLAAGCSEDNTVTPDPTPKEGTAVGNLAPSFTMPDQNNNEVRLKDYRGKVVILEFWRSTCQTCTDEMKDLEVLWNEHRNSGDLVIIGISGDEFESNWRAYISASPEQTQSGYPRDWVQVWNRMWDIADMYKVEGTPHRYLIDKNGVVVDNYMTVDEMDALVAAELAK